MTLALPLLQNLLDVEQRHQYRAFAYAVRSEKERHRCQRDGLGGLKGAKVGQGYFRNAHGFNALVLPIGQTGGR